jgi:hypothetical protein
MARPKKKEADPLPDVLFCKPKESEYELSIDNLLSGAIEIVDRELTQIRLGAVSGKLPPEMSRDLVAYTKLLYDIKNDSSDALEAYTDEELMTLATK